MRRLNSVERAWHIVGKHGSANAMRSFRISGPLTRGIAEKAFGGVLKIYPILCCRIAADGKNFRFVKNESSPPKVIFRDQPFNLSEHHDLTASLINAGIDPENMPLLQFIVATTDRADSAEHWIYLNFHHSISDGMTKIAVMQCFLSLCDAVLESDSAFETVLTQLIGRGADLSPSLTDSFMPRGIVSRTAALLRFISRRALRQTAYSDIYPSSATLAAEHTDLDAQQRAPKAPRCRIFEATLPTSFAQQVLAVAKQNSLTLHELVTAALLKSIRTVLFFNDRRPGFSCISFVNLRNRCSPPISVQAVGCYVSAAFSFHHVAATTDLIGLAKDISAQIKYAIDSEVVEQATYASWMAKTLLAVGKKNIATLSISNIGLVSKALAAKNYTVHEVHVHSALSGVGSAVSVGLTSTNECLAFDFTFLEDIAAQADIENIFLLTKEILDSLIAANPQSPRTPEPPIIQVAPREVVPKEFVPRGFTEQHV
jgi:hypothetical protein